MFLCDSRSPGLASTLLGIFIVCYALLLPFCSYEVYLFDQYLNTVSTAVHKSSHLSKKPLKEHKFFSSRRLGLAFSFQYSLIFVIAYIPLFHWYDACKRQRQSFFATRSALFITYSAALAPVFIWAARWWLLYYDSQMQLVASRQQRRKLWEQTHLDSSMLTDSNLLKETTMIANRPLHSPKKSTSPRSGGKSKSLHQSKETLERNWAEEFQKTAQALMHQTLTKNDLFSDSENSTIREKNASDDSVSFWEKHRNELGTYKSVCIITAAVYSVVVALVGVLLFTMKSPAFGFGVAVCVAVLFMISVVALEFFMSGYRDSLFIQDELHKIAFLALIAFIGYFVIYVSSLIVFSQTGISGTPLGHFIVDTIMFGCLLLAAIGCVIISSGYLVSKHRKYLAMLTATSNRMSSDSETRTRADTTMTMTSDLFAFLEHDVGFYLFLDFLIREFSSETLLFLCEIVSLKNNFSKALLRPPDIAICGPKTQAGLSVVSDEKEKEKEKEAKSDEDSDSESETIGTDTGFGANTPQSPMFGLLGSSEELTLAAMMDSAAKGVAAMISPLETVDETGAVAKEKDEDAKEHTAVIVSNSKVDDTEADEVVKEDASVALFKDEDVKDGGEDVIDGDLELAMDEVIKTQSSLGVGLSEIGHSKTITVEPDDVDFNIIMSEMATATLRYRQTLKDEAERSRKTLPEAESTPTPRPSADAPTTVPSTSSAKPKPKGSSMQAALASVPKRTVLLPNLPRDLTKTDTMLESDLQMAIRMICRRFIRENGIMVVNISSEARRQLMRRVYGVESLRHHRRANGALKDIDAVHLSPDIFDEAASECIRLLRDPFSRFRKEESYKRFHREQQRRAQRSVNPFM